MAFNAAKGVLAGLLCLIGLALILLGFYFVRTQHDPAENLAFALQMQRNSGGLNNQTLTPTLEASAEAEGELRRHNGGAMLVAGSMCMFPFVGLWITRRRA